MKHESLGYDEDMDTVIDIESDCSNLNDGVCNIICDFSDRNEKDGCSNRELRSLNDE